MTEEKLFSVAEVAVIAGVEESTVRKWLSRGEILSVKYQKQNFLPASEVSLALYAECDSPEKGKAFDAKYGLDRDTNEN